APSLLQGAPGSVAQAEYTFLVEPRPGRALPEGATFLLRGWSVPIRSERIRIVSAWLDAPAGTAAAAGGVVTTEATTGAGNEGVTCTVALPPESPLELAFGSTHALLRLQMEAWTDRPRSAL